MKQTTIKEINEYKSKSIDPRKEPETVFEMYSVPAYSTGHPEYLSGEQIASNKVIVEKNDILLCKINPRINRVWVVQDESEKQNIASSEWIVIRTKKYNPEYLAWYFQSPKFKQLMVSEVTGIGGSLTRAQPKRIANYPVPNIEREKQDEIVKRLNLLHDSIQKRKEEIQLFDELIKARFVEMFGKNVFNREQLKNNVQEMFIGPFGSSLKNDSFVDKNNGYCVVYEQKHAIKKSIKMSFRYVTKEKYEELKRWTILPGDIIVSCRGTIGEIYEIPKNAPMGIMHPSIMKIRLNETYDHQFFVSMLQQYMEEEKVRSVGSSVKMAITASSLGKKEFIVPPISTQHEYSSFVQQIDKSKAAIQKSIDKTQMLFDSLMQEYFS